MRIVNVKGRFCIERPQRWGYALFGVLLGVGGFAVSGWLLSQRGTDAAVLVGIVALVMLFPAVAFADAGSRKRSEIVALTETQDLTGGVIVTVVDDTQNTHQLVTDSRTAADLTQALETR